MFGANAGMKRVNNLSLTGNKTIQEIDFLIINIGDVLGTKKTLFFTFRGHTVLATSEVNRRKTKSACSARESMVHCFYFL
jgi:hypothetical protein